MKLLKNKFLALAVLLAAGPAAQAQQRPYIGFVYPAGGQQGATFQVTLGGQTLEELNGAMISGAGIKARLVEYNKKINNQELELLNEQLKELKKAPAESLDEKATNMIARIDKLLREHVNQPQCASIANLAVVEVAIAPDAAPGEREIRLVTPKGVSNPLVFIVGRLPEVSAPPVPTSLQQVLGREEQSLRKKQRPAGGQTGAEMTMMAGMMEAPGAPSALDDEEVGIKPPCTVNGQITSGTVDRYRFTARKGQRLVIMVQARALIPYLADAVPGWFQPVLELYNAQGKEAAYQDDYRFKPDPVMFYEVPGDGEYRLAIRDALYRGREDFVYRMTIGELPFVTGIFPLGGRAGGPAMLELQGWNLAESALVPDMEDDAPGVYPLSAGGQDGSLANPVPFALDTLPECTEREAHNTPATAQKVTLPVIVNGRIDPPGNRDVFQFEGQAGDEIVAEVHARRLDSPLDSLLKLTDADGNCLAFNDDHEDPAAGLVTHHADSYLRASLPEEGAYYIYLGDTQHHGGREYAYRLRISAPQPDFALRVVPSSVSIRSNSTAGLSVYAIRQDGFTNNIKLGLRNAPAGFELKGGNLNGTQELVKVTLKTTLGETKEPVNLVVEGTAMNKKQKIVHEAVPAEDRMQAFLWRHLVPAQELKAFVFTPPPPPPKPAAATNAVPEPAKTSAPPAIATSNSAPAKTSAPPAAAKP